MFLNERCAVCGRKLTGRFGSLPMSFKYCPACGADGNPLMKTVQHGWLYWWALELGMAAWTVVCASFFYFFGNTLVAVIMGGMAYGGNRLLTKTCRSCHSISSAVTHRYCHNCGQKLRSNL